MARKKTSRYLRRHAITAAAVISLALALVVVIATPDLRSRLNSSLNSGANFFLFDDDETEEASEGAPGEASPDGKAAAPRKSSGFRRVMTAPVRLFARLFKGKSNNDVAMKKSSDKDLENMRVIPVNRSQNGIIADTGAGVTTEATTAEGSSKKQFEEAIELRDKGRIDGAIQRLVAATVLQPNFAEAFNLLAVCYDEKSQYRAAQDEYKKALKLEPNNARFLNNIGYSYYLSNDFGSAIKYYDRGLKITPNDRRMHNNIGLAYGRKGEYENARRHFVIAVGETGAELNLGYVYTQQGKYDDAIFHYEAALTTQPQSLTALGNLVNLYERTGRPREAATLSERYKRLAAAGQQKEQTVDQQ